MTAAWISPWSGEQLTADELIREVALDALSQLYLVDILGCPAPVNTVGSDEVIVKSAGIDYEYVIPYPHTLSDRMSAEFQGSLEALQSEYGLVAGTQYGHCLNGDQVGAMLVYFNALDRLVRIVSAAHCWDKEQIVAVHGIPEGHDAQTLGADLASAGCHYLVLNPSKDERGSGCFMSVNMAAAIALVNRLWSRQEGAVEQFFGLQRMYGAHVWLSDDSTWHAEDADSSMESRTGDSS